LADSAGGIERSLKQKETIWQQALYKKSELREGQEKSKK